MHLGQTLTIVANKVTFDFTKKKNHNGNLVCVLFAIYHFMGLTIVSFSCQTVNYDNYTIFFFSWQTNRTSHMLWIFFPYLYLCKIFWLIIQWIFYYILNDHHHVFNTRPTYMSSVKMFFGCHNLPGNWLKPKKDDYYYYLSLAASCSEEPWKRQDGCTSTACARQQIAYFPAIPQFE